MEQETDAGQCKPKIGAEDYCNLWKCMSSKHGAAEPGSDESKAMWDKKAASFAKKPNRSDYISQLISLLSLQEGESVFDMGCGSGTLSIPLVLSGHNVVAVDFSDGMLDQLNAAASERSISSDSLQVFRRSWQEDWNDIPGADVAVASRSFVTNNLAEGVAKLESKATRAAAVTLGAGDLPYRDSQIYKAMGRTPEIAQTTELSCLVGYLFSIGRLPRVEYIEYPGKTGRGTEEALRKSMLEAYRPTPEELPLLEEYLDQHIVFDEESGNYRIDHDRTDRWALVMWNVHPEENVHPVPRKLDDHMAVKGCVFKDSQMLVLYKPEDARQRSAVLDREEDLPGGCVEKGESLEEALVREVLEETGLMVEVGRPFSAWSIDAPMRRILGIDFICHWVSGEVELSWEHESYEWLTLEQLKGKNWELQDVYEEAFRLAE